MIKTEMYKQRISKPDFLTERGKYSQALSQFMESDNMTLKLVCSNIKEAESCYTCLNSHNRKHNFNLCIWKRNCEVYAIKG